MIVPQTRHAGGRGRQNPNAYVIAVCGTSGAGKTTVVRRTAKRLGDAACLHFDDYAAVSSYPADIGAWIELGGDLSEWRTPQLTEDLRRLKAGHAVHDPLGRGAVEPAAFVVVEEPFGRLRPEIGHLIDLVAFVDVPMDIALVRRMLREFADGAPRHPDGYATRLRELLTHYLREGRDAYLAGIRLVRPPSDLILNGTRPVEELAQTIATEALAQRHAGA